MEFKDEFEYEWNGDIFYVEVHGELIHENNFEIKEINKLSIKDDSGEEIENTDLRSEIFEEALSRDIEVHASDFDYCDSDINNFLKE